MTGCTIVGLLVTSHQSSSPPSERGTGRSPVQEGGGTGRQGTGGGVRKAGFVTLGHVKLVPAGAAWQEVLPGPAEGPGGGGQGGHTDTYRSAPVLMSTCNSN